MTVGAEGRGDLNQAVVTRNVGGVSRFPSISMAGGAITTSREVFADCAVDTSTNGIVTAATGVVHLGITAIDQWRWVTMTTATGSSGHCHQICVTRGVARVGRFPGSVMAGGTIARSCFPNRQADQITGQIIVAAGASEM